MNIVGYLQGLSTLRLWLLSIACSVLMTEVIVCGMETLLFGKITYDYLLTGFVASLCVATLVTAGLVYFLKQQRQAAKMLEQRVAEEVAKNLKQERLLIQQSRLAAMGEMIGNIAHQWRQPLNALGLNLQNIRDAQEFGELTPEYLERSTEAGMQLINRMSATIDDFRNFFKPNRDKVSFSLEQAARAAIAILSASLDHHGIRIRLDSAGDILAWGFPNEFSQALLNILSNAKDAFDAKQTKQGEIQVRISSRGDHGTLIIRDNAGGIPAEVLPKIFEPYFTTKKKGTGIGLYMSKMIVEDNMGGRIEARNVEGGAEFAISCPLAP